MAKLSISNVFELLKSLGKDLLAIFDFTFGNLWRTIEDFIGNIGNKLIETLNKAFR